MKKFIFTILALLFSQMNSFSEEIHFDNEVYKLRFSAISPQTQGYGNEYFKENEDVSNWNKMIGIYYYPNEDNPIQYTEDFGDEAENTENSVLLKIVENKKANKAVISLLVNGEENSKKYFEYDIYKFEKHPSKGMMVSKYAIKYNFNNESEIANIVQQVKENNDKYFELFIISQTPSVIEKDISSESFS